MRVVADISNAPNAPDSLIESMESWIFAQARHPSGSSKGGQWRGTGAGKGKGGGAGGAAKSDAIGNKIRGESKEHGAAWGADGKLIAEYSSGQDNQIKTPNEVLQKGEGGYRLHNHPPATSRDSVGGASLSPGDLDQAAWNRIHETRVVSVLDGNPVDYIAGGFDKLTDNASDGSLLGNKMDVALRKHMNGVDWQVTKGVMRGKLGNNPSQSLSFAAKTHAAIKLTSKEFNFSYGAKWKGIINDTTGQVGTLDDALGLLGMK